MRRNLFAYGVSLLAARLAFMRRPDAFALGALLNMWGLMELIAFNVRVELGILCPRNFAMTVLMALTAPTRVRAPRRT